MSTTRSRRPRAVRAAVTAATAALLSATLSGCGDAHPGAAAVVDGQSVEMADVDAMTTAVCSAAAQSSSGTLPLGYLRGLALDSAVKRAVADQLADEYDVTAGSAYQQSLSQLRTQALSLPLKRRTASCSGRVRAATSPTSPNRWRAASSPTRGRHQRRRGLRAGGVRGRRLGAAPAGGRPALRRAGLR
ncbi:MAG: hypothetical protein R2731_06440 [Nocardioides sp.]